MWDITLSWEGGIADADLRLGEKRMVKVGLGFVVGVAVVVAAVRTGFGIPAESALEAERVELTDLSTSSMRVAVVAAAVVGAVVAVVVAAAAVDVVGLRALLQSMTKESSGAERRAKTKRTQRDSTNSDWARVVEMPSG